MTNELSTERNSPLRPLLGLLLALGLFGGSVVTARTQDATPDVDLEQGVVYSEVDGESLQLDVYRLPAGGRLRPAVVLLPGWGVSRIGMLAQGLELAKAGYVAVAVDYRLDWPEFIDDAQMAVRWVRANAGRYGVDPERICAYGWSAGGHLAAMLAVRDTRDEADPDLAEYSSKVACAVALAGQTDLTVPHPEPLEVKWMVEHLGGTLTEAPEAYRDVSPVAFVDEESAPIFVIQGTREPAYLVDQARRLVAALEAAGVEVVYAELDDEDHPSVADWQVTGAFTLAFLDRHLHPER